MEGEIKAREPFFWRLRLFAGAAIIYLGIVSLVNYSPRSIIGNATEVGIALITIGLSFLWLSLLMFLYERKVNEGSRES